MKFLTQGMGEPEISATKRTDRVDRMINLFMKLKRHPSRNRNYALKFFILEILNLFNVLSQIFVIDKFLGGKFLNYGVEMLGSWENFNNHDYDPMAYVFPKVTKCVFKTHSINADITPHDALCVLSLNIVNEKIYLLMWLWLIALTCVSAIAVFYRMAAVMFPSLRTYLLFKLGSNKWSHVADICREGKY